MFAEGPSEAVQLLRGDCWLLEELYLEQWIFQSELWLPQLVLKAHKIMQNYIGIHILTCT